MTSTMIHETSHFDPSWICESESLAIRNFVSICSTAFRKALDETKSYCAIEHSEFNDLIRLFSRKTFSTDEQLIKHRRERKVAATSSAAEKFQSQSKRKRFFFRSERKKFFNHVRFDCDMCATPGSTFYRANWQCEKLPKFGGEKCKRHAKVRTFEALCAMIDVARDAIANFAAAHQSNLNFFRWNREPNKNSRLQLNRFYIRKFGSGRVDDEIGQTVMMTRLVSRHIKSFISFHACLTSSDDPRRGIVSRLKDETKAKFSSAHQNDFHKSTARLRIRYITSLKTMKQFRFAWAIARKCKQKHKFLLLMNL